MNLVEIGFAIFYCEHVFKFYRLHLFSPLLSTILHCNNIAMWHCHTTYHFDLPSIWSQLTKLEHFKSDVRMTFHPYPSLGSLKLLDLYQFRHRKEFVDLTQEMNIGYNWLNDFHFSVLPSKLEYFTIWSWWTVSILQQ